jgi:DNA polymerase III alpha subunit
MMNKFGDYVLNEKEVVNVLYNNPNVDLTKLNITDVEKFNDAIANLYLANGKLEQYIEPNVSVEEFDKQYQQNWYMPQEYKELDIAEYLLNLCQTDTELQRVGHELLEYQKIDFFDALRFLKYFVDIMRNNNIVWGVGRGSSVASYVLYLLGIHKIDSIKYNLPYNEFFK